jgi:hypothetical protein
MMTSPLNGIEDMKIKTKENVTSAPSSNIGVSDKFQELMKNDLEDCPQKKPSFFELLADLEKVEFFSVEIETKDYLEELATESDLSEESANGLTAPYPNFSFFNNSAFIEDDEIEMKQEITTFRVMKKKEEDLTDNSGPVILPLAQVNSFATNISSLNILANPLPAQISDLFETMVSHLVHMNSTSINETVVFLDNPSSAFHGAKIVIREFSSAPRIFNIEFIANPQAAALFQLHTNDLLATFQQQNFEFSINRIDTSIFHQKASENDEKSSWQDDEKDQEGKHKQ